MNKSNYGGLRSGAGRPIGAKSKVGADIRELAQQYSTDAITALVSILNNQDSPAAARVAAANTLLDRGYGKPHQSIEATVTAAITDLTDAELDKRIAELAKQTGLA